MAPKKGVSFDDKRLRLLEIFARAEVFTLKEIEKIGSKEKGIVEQTIKDVLQTLVDDALVETDKIGAGNFLRGRAGKAYNTIRRDVPLPRVIGSQAFGLVVVRIEKDNGGVG